MIELENRLEIGNGATLRQRVRRIAWIVVLVADAGLLAWCAMAALAPHHLAGPSTASIVRDGYEGFTGLSWDALVDRAPATADFTTLVFRMYGVYGVAFSLTAMVVAATALRRGERWAWWALLIGNAIGYGAPMTYDRVVHAVGPFEMLEYVGIAIVFAALAIARPRAAR